MRIARRLRLSLLILGLIAGVASAARAEDSLIRARAVWDLLAGEKYDEFAATGDETMQAGFNADQARQIWASLNFQLGKYQGVTQTNALKQGEYDAVVFVCAFERGSATIRIVLNAAGQLSGFWFDKVEPKAAYEPPDYVDPKAFREEEVTVKCGESELPGKLCIPLQGEKHPGLVLVHGSGPHDEDESIGPNKPFRDLAWGLASRGIAVLRYQKRTQKYGKEIKPDQYNLEWETIEDAVAAAALLRERPEVDPKRVFVLGHSLGGMAAPFIAEKDARLAGVVLLAANARSVLDLVIDQVEYLAKADGSVGAEEAAQIEDLKAQLALVRDGKADDVEKPILGAPAKYWADLHGRDHTAATLRLKCPILVIHGGRDYQVTRKDYDIWKSKLSERENVTIRFYDALNHLMIFGSGPSTPQEYQTPGHVDQAVVEDITAWINRH